MQTNNEKFMERINEVESKIRAYARFFAFKAQLLTEDDLYQQAMLELLERYHEDAEFLNQNNSYISCFASWAMKNYLAREYNMYAKRVVGLEPEKGEFQMTGHYPAPEAQAIRSEIHSIAEQMPKPYSTIFDEIISGYTPEETANRLGITKWALKWRKHHLMENLCKAWRSSAAERKYIIRAMNESPLASR